jgi:hypothetical protein
VDEVEASVEPLGEVGGTEEGGLRSCGEVEADDDGLKGSHGRLDSGFMGTDAARWN